MGTLQNRDPHVGVSFFEGTLSGLILRGIKKPFFGGGELIAPKKTKHPPHRSLSFWAHFKGKPKAAFGGGGTHSQKKTMPPTKNRAPLAQIKKPLSGGELIAKQGPAQNRLPKTARPKRTWMLKQISLPSRVKPSSAAWSLIAGATRRVAYKLTFE